MAFNPTKEQHSAIFEKGNILVSAAAGSGKTAVLVERVISLLCDKNTPVSADELLIVTFTNAAAAEMRSRIEKRLDEECRKHPDDTGLLLQKHLLSNARICTIDSFCIDFVRENFDKLDISPDFKISDGYSLRAINEDVIYKIINRYLEQKDGLFLELTDIIGAEFDENNFAEFILEIYEYSRQLPFPKKWFKELGASFCGGNFTPQNEWYKYSFNKAKACLSSMCSLINNAIELVSVVEPAAPYLSVFFATRSSLYELLDTLNTNDWDTFFYALQNFKVLKLPTVRGVSGYETVNAAKSIYKYIGDKGLESIKKLFYADFRFINSQFKKLYKPLERLIDILIEFDETLFAEYKNQNTFTFHNIEHLALSLLCYEADGEIIIKPEAQEFLDRFKEVMVDEYQDTNDLQDILFYVLSDKEKKLFVVGDVKQSIYAFRGANPSNFLNKKNRYISLEKSENDDPKKIILGNNFRTKNAVCDFINYFFRQFMSKETGSLEYSFEEALLPSSVYPETEDISVSCDIIDCKESDDKPIVLEARRIAEYIKATINGKPCIKQDDTTLRKAKYGDFTIMLRSLSGKGSELADELKKQGIPVNLNSTDFVESTEISTFLALLKVLDNPQSDIELLTVMLSPMFRFTTDEMAEIRIAKKDGSLYSAVINASIQGNSHVKDFLSVLEKYRLYAVTLPLPKLILKLLIDTEYLNIVSAMSGGEKRKNNLLLLCDYAEQFANGNTPNLSGFVKYILKQSQYGISASNVSASGDYVKIMTIHASKGLQFPICIIASCATRFNDAESRSSTVFSTKYGIGFKYFDEIDKTKYTTISREVILDSLKANALEEELRLLYVAMTRTQDKLVFVSAYPNFEKSLADYKNLLLSTNCKVDSNLFSRTKSYADWLILACLLHPCGKALRGNGSSIMPQCTDSEIEINIIAGGTLQTHETVTENADAFVDEYIVNAIKENIAFTYPFEDILNIEAKTSVSVIANKAESEKYSFTALPSFMSDGGITATERGTAMHRVMQFFDFKKSEDIEAEIERLYEWQFISERERASLNIDALKTFFESDIFKRIKNSDIVKREMRFLTEIPAKEIESTLPDRFNDEKIIIQGAVDVCFVENGELVILDFKTDRVDDLSQLSDTYGNQLSYYALACQKIFGLPVKEKVIYSFAKGDTVKII